MNNCFFYFVERRSLQATKCFHQEQVFVGTKELVVGCRKELFARQDNSSSAGENSPSGTSELLAAEMVFVLSHSACRAWHEVSLRCQVAGTMAGDERFVIT